MQGFFKAVSVLPEKGIQPDLEQAMYCICVGLYVGRKEVSNCHFKGRRTRRVKFCKLQKESHECRKTNMKKYNMRRVINQIGRCKVIKPWSNIATIDLANGLYIASRIVVLSIPSPKPNEVALATTRLGFFLTATLSVKGICSCYCVPIWMLGDGDRQ